MERLLVAVSDFKLYTQLTETLSHRLTHFTNLSISQVQQHNYPMKKKQTKTRFLKSCLLFKFLFLHLVRY